MVLRHEVRILERQVHGRVRYGRGATSALSAGVARVLAPYTLWQDWAVSAVARCDFPVPGLPIIKMFSHLSMYSQRAKVSE